MTKLRFFEPIVLPEDEVWFGELLFADASRVIIENGDQRAEYIGDFEITPTGDATGTLVRFREWRDGKLAIRANDLNVDVTRYIQAVQVQRDLETVLAIVLENDDYVYLSPGNDAIRTFGGEDEVRGGRGNDTIVADNGSDRVYGGLGNDRLEGGRGNDALYGNAGRDELVGANGRDDLRGGRGSDMLHGGAGHDDLWGGDGSDEFLYQRGDSLDRIHDFATEDYIRLVGFEKGRALTEILADSVERRGSTYLDFDGRPGIDLILYDFIMLERRHLVLEAEMVPGDDRASPPELVDVPDPSTLPPVPGELPPAPILPRPDLNRSDDLPRIEPSALPNGAALLETVPQYEWWGGCGPTAVASVFAHWDLAGYGDLFEAEGFSELRRTVNVRDEIASPQHFAKFARINDDGSAADDGTDVAGLSSPFNSIADFFRTSVDPLDFGWSRPEYTDNAFEEYASFKGYGFDATTTLFGNFTFAELKREIDAGRPVVALVDSTNLSRKKELSGKAADGIADHLVPIVGYDDRGAEGEFFYFFKNWSESEYPEYPSITEWKGVSTDDAWGVAAVTTVEPITAPDAFVA